MFTEEFDIDLSTFNKLIAVSFIFFYKYYKIDFKITFTNTDIEFIDKIKYF